MKLQLTVNEIQGAVECFLTKQGLDLSGYDIDMTLVAGAQARIEIDLEPKEESKDSIPEGPVARSSEETTSGSPFATE